MSAEKLDGHTTILNQICDRLTTDLPPTEAAKLTAFAIHYLRRVPQHELAERDVAVWAAIIRRHFEFAGEHRRGQILLRIFNPTVEDDGWESSHTVIQVVNDDMPFLVDSVRMALNRRGLTTHLVIHPVMRLRRDADGRVVEVLQSDTPSDGALTEAVMHLEVDRQTDQEVLDGIVTDHPGRLAGRLGRR